MPDDLGWNDVGYNGSEIQTPHLDRLARDGIRLNQHYVSPVCSPSRAALLTGRFPSRFGILGPIAGKSTQILPDDVRTLPSLLAESGYETHISGKWHLSLSSDHGPTQYGFKTSYGYLHGQIDPYTHRYKFGDATWHRNDQLIEEEGHVTDLITEDAIRYINETRDKPFFLAVTYSVPHYPLAEPEEWIGLYEDAISERSRRTFAASVSHMDSGIGRIVETIETNGLTESTLIVFSSDNGGQDSWLDTEDLYEGRYPPDPVLGDNRPLRGWKGEVYEGGIRVPALAYWPGVLDPGVMDQPVHIVDWLPTLLALSDMQEELPDDLDGQDIWPLLLDPGSELKLKPIYITGAGEAALRVGDWKLIELRAGETELYNLREDPAEENNLADTESHRRDELISLLRRQQEKDGAAVHR